MSERLIEIKTLLEDCLNTNCHKKKTLLITKKNKKLAAINAIAEADDLLFENIKLVYNEDLIDQKKLYDEQINIYQFAIKKLQKKIFLTLAKKYGVLTGQLAIYVIIDNKVKIINL